MKKISTDLQSQSLHLLDLAIKRPSLLKGRKIFLNSLQNHSALNKTLQPSSPYEAAQSQLGDFKTEAFFQHNMPTLQMQALKNYSSIDQKRAAFRPKSAFSNALQRSKNRQIQVLA